MKQVNRPKLILGDAVRPAKVVRLRLLRRIIVVGVLQIPEYTVDFLLCEDAIKTQTSGLPGPANPSALGRRIFSGWKRRPTRSRSGV